MKCATCSHMDKDKYPVAAKVGMILCKFEVRPATFTSFTKERECDQYKGAAEAVIQQRRDWWIEIKRKEKDDLRASQHRQRRWGRR